MNKISSMRDSNLAANIVRSTPLFYLEGAAPSLDRPSYVRSASGIAWSGNYFAVVQDDANFIALVDTKIEKAIAVTLPAGEGGKRQFDDTRGNKKFKMDLESCVLVRHENQEILITFGSGSNPFRENIVILRNLSEAPIPEVYNAAELYKILRSAKDFAGSELNIEGAVFLDKKIRLFNRGNGAASEDTEAVNASCDLDWQSLYDYLINSKKQPPALQNITRYYLGILGDLALGLTDATDYNGKLFFSAAAEDSPDAVTDGEVSGSALGVLDKQNKIRWIEITHGDGNRFNGKVEGITFLKNEPNRVFVVVDQDSPEKASELCEIQLLGPWFEV
jgi:hypothetical protein